MTLKTTLCAAAALILGGAVALDAQTDPLGRRDGPLSGGDHRSETLRGPDSEAPGRPRLRGTQDDPPEVDPTPDILDPGSEPDVPGRRRNPLDERDDDPLGGGRDRGLGDGLGGGPSFGG